MIRPAGRLTRRDLLQLAAAGMLLAVHFATWIASLQYTSVAISTLLVATSPLWNAAYDALAGQIRISWVTAVALTAGLGGLALIVAQRAIPAPIPGHALLGDGLAVAGSLAFAAYLIAVRPIRARSDTRSIVTVTYSAAALALAVAAAFAHQAPPPLWAHAAWGGILGMALLSQLLGHTGMNAALRWFQATTVSLSTLVEPVIAAAAAWLVFGEAVGAIAAAGAALVLASVGCAIWTIPSPGLD